MSRQDNGPDQKRPCEEASLYSMIRNHQHDQTRASDRASSRDQTRVDRASSSDQTRTSPYRIEDCTRSSMMSKYAKSSPDMQKQSNASRHDQRRADSDPRRRHSGVDQADQRQTGSNQRKTSLDSKRDHKPSGSTYRNTRAPRLELFRQKQTSLDSKLDSNQSSSQGLAIDFNDHSKPGIYHRHSSLDSNYDQKRTNSKSQDTRHCGVDQIDHGQSGINQKQSKLDSNQVLKRSSPKSKDNRRFGMIQPDHTEHSEHKKQSSPAHDSGQSGKDQSNQRQSSSNAKPEQKRSSPQAQNYRHIDHKPSSHQQQHSSSNSRDQRKSGKDQRQSSVDFKPDQKRSSSDTARSQQSRRDQQHQKQVDRTNDTKQSVPGSHNQQTVSGSQHHQKRSNCDSPPVKTTSGLHSAYDAQRHKSAEQNSSSPYPSAHQERSSPHSSAHQEQSSPYHSQHEERSSPVSTVDRKRSSPTRDRHDSSTSDQSKAGAYVEKLSLGFQAQLLKQELSNEAPDKRDLHEDMRREGSIRKQNKRYAVIIDDVLEVPLDLPGPISRDSLDYTHQRRYHNLLQEHMTMKHQQASKVGKRQMTIPHTARVSSEDRSATNGGSAPSEDQSVTKTNYDVTKDKNSVTIDNMSVTVDTESTPSVRKQRELFEVKIKKDANHNQQYKPCSPKVKDVHKGSLLRRQYKRDSDDQQHSQPAKKYNKTDTRDNGMVARNVKKPIWPPPQPTPHSDHSGSESEDDTEDILLSGTLKHHEIKKIPFTDERFHIFQPSSRAKAAAPKRVDESRRETATSKRVEESTPEKRTAAESKRVEETQITREKATEAESKTEEESRHGVTPTTTSNSEHSGRQLEGTAAAPKSNDESSQAKITATARTIESKMTGLNETAAARKIEHEDSRRRKDAAVEKINKDECQICWSTMVGSTELKTMHCSHQFHTFCINEWFQEVSTCPTCGTNCKQEAGLVGKNKMADCQICWCDFEARQLVKSLPCRHHFHYHCIIHWFEEDGKCPTCRREHKQDETRLTTDCPLCHRDLTEDLQTLPCSHKYHAPCITRWFKDKTNCPICQLDCTKYRREMREEEERIQLEEDAALARQLYEEEEQAYRLKMAHPEESDRRKVCQICKVECVAADDVKFLPCIHCFHKTCIDRWLKEVKKCPICRTDCSNIR